MKQLFFLLLLLFLIQSCGDSIVESIADENLVSFYLLKDDKIKATDAAGVKLESLELSESPLITSKTIGYYKWKDHSFSIDSVCANKLQEYSNLHKSVYGIPFVVKVGNERIYLGAFWYSYSSIAPTFPYVDITFSSLKATTILVINKSWLDKDADIRTDLRIYNAFKKNGLLIE